MSSTDLVRASDAHRSTFTGWLLRRLLEMCGRPRVRVVLWNGVEVRGDESAPPVATVRIHDAGTFARLLVRPEVTFGEGYASGAIDFEGDLVAFLEPVSAPAVRLGPIQRAAFRILDRPRSNGIDRSRKNIHTHYDLGNDFYELWLDERMVYTCAYYRKRSEALDDAQLAKLDLVCRKLELAPGERVLEAGCGWGALAIHMAERYGVTVEAYNVSREQIAYAREQARRRGLEERVKFIDGDYRDARGRFDAFVSVGMLEHVGRDHYADLGAVIDRTLSAEGRGLLHFIGRPRACAMNAWTERYIFPGAYIPALSEALAVLEPHDLQVLDVENLRLHYARTLEQWLERFEQKRAVVESRFDEAFVRMWRLYLASSLAGFRAGSLELYQVVFARAARHALPLTRAHLHERGLERREPERWNAARS